MNRFPPPSAILTSCVAVTLAVGVCCSADAAPILINNYSFEANNVGGNTLGGQPPTDWSQADLGDPSVGANGTVYAIFDGHTNVQPPAATGDDLQQDGDDDMMAMFRYDVILYQVLSTNIAANTTYTLTIDAADRSGNRPSFSDNGTIRLGTGNTAGANLLTPDAISTGQTSNAGWTEWTATFSTGAVVPAEALRVEIVQFGVSGQDPQGLADYVRLDAIPSVVPEPASLSLLAIGGLLLAGRCRRDRD